MDKWDNQKLVSQISWLDYRQFLFFSCVYQELNKRTIKNVNMCIVLCGTPHHYL